MPPPKPAESQERADMRRWVETWKLAGPELAAIRRQELKETDNVRAVEQMGEVFNQSTRHLPPRQSSGLVEMQRLLAKLPKKPQT